MYLCEPALGRSDPAGQGGHVLALLHPEPDYSPAGTLGLKGACLRTSFASIVTVNIGISMIDLPTRAALPGDLTSRLSTVTVLSRDKHRNLTWWADKDGSAAEGTCRQA